MTSEELIGSDALCFENGTQWEPIPNWAKLFVNLGKTLGRRKLGDTRLVVGLAVPTRAYGSALTAFGIVVGTTGGSAPSDDLDTHFQRLLSLRKGQPLTYLVGERKLKALFNGYEEFRGEIHLRVQVTKKASDGRKSGGRIYLVPKEHSMFVMLRQGDSRELPAEQKGRLLVSRMGFLQKLLQEDPTDFVMNSRLECVLVGQVGILRTEVRDQRFSVGRPQSADEMGTLQDAVRIQQFLGEGEPFRSAAFKALSTHGPDAGAHHISHAAVLDGNTAFLKWRHLFGNNHVVAVLDRTGSNFAEAVEALNYDYVQNRLGDADLEFASELPSGIEVIAYEEETREKHKLQ